MKRRMLIKIFSGIAAFILVILLLMTLVIKPWVQKKIISVLRSAQPDFTIAAGKINTVFLPPGIEFEDVSIVSNKSKRILDVKIKSIKFDRIHLPKLIFKNDVHVGEVIIVNSIIEGRISFSSVKHIISSLDIFTGKIFFKKVDLSIRDISSAESWFIKDGFFNFYDFELAEKDTLRFDETGPSDFRAREVVRVSPDSFYTFRILGIDCSSSAHTLQIDSFLVLPNYKNYDFTSRHEFQTDCVRAEAKNISAADFNIADYFKSDAMVSSLVKIENIDLKIFRDRRKKIQHKKKASLQGLLYKYPGRVNIDSIHVDDGTVVYTEHGENSKEPGTIRFEKVNAGIYHVTNDTLYKENAFIEFKTEALLMGKTKLTSYLKAKLFDSTDAFIMSGGLSKMDVRDLNPILERNAFIHAESGQIDTMSFNFTANNYASTGTVILLYNIFFVKPEAEYAVVPASLMQLLVSAITSKKIEDANPSPGEKVRVGTIAFERDPEKFIFNYWYKSVLSGIKSAIAKNQN